MKQLELFNTSKPPEKSWFYEWEIDCSGVEKETSPKNPPNLPTAPPSKIPPTKTRRKKGDGTGYIYRRTITRKGKKYQESYYRYRDSSGKQRAKYIPKKLLDLVLLAESRKLPVLDILVLLGGDEISRGEQFSSINNGVRARGDRTNRGERVTPPSTKLVKQPPDKEYTQSTTTDNNVLLGGDEISRGEQLKKSKIKVENTQLQTSDFRLLSSSAATTTPSTKRRKPGYGTGYIEMLPVKRNGKEYKQYWYHYEEWQNGNRKLKKSKYIPKRIESKIKRMNDEKVPVKDILTVLRNRSKRKK